MRIIILGKPNVGKSSLFNRLLKQRIAITSDVSGTTRDINIKSFEANGLSIDICDTAGIQSHSNHIQHGIFDKTRTLRHIHENDVILYVISAKEGIDDYDIRFFRELKNAILVVNKIDCNHNEEWEYSAFGTRNVFFISALHNRGISALKNHLTTLLARDDSLCGDSAMPKETLDSADSLESAESTIRVGIIGRVNVGKSSLLNALLGKERAMVSEVEGTTIDPVDDTLRYENKILHFVDTAGIRRRSRIEGIEKYALHRTKEILSKSDIVLLVLNSSNPFVDLDEKISGLSDTYKLGIIIVLNKWDIKYASFAHIQSEIKRKFAYLSHAPIITASALSLRHIDVIKRTIVEVHDNFTRRISTSLLNETISNATRNHPLPSSKGRMVKIYYATQVAHSPPQIVLVVNHPSALHFSYKRYLVNWLRKHFDFSGVPIIIMPRGKNANIEEPK